MRQDTAAYDSKEVVSSVAEHLAKLRGTQSDEPPTPAPEPEENEGQPTPEVEQDETPAAEPDPKPEEQEAGQDEPPAIPDPIYRAVIHNGWTPEEIAEFHQANPKQAMKVFEKLHQATNDLSRQFAEIGRTRINLERQKSQPPAKEEQPPESFIDVEALRKQDPDNPLLSVVEGMNKALLKLTAQRPVEQPQQRHQAQTQEDIALATQVMTFLGSDQLKTYDDFYGPAYDEARMPTFDGHGLTPGQRANREALIEQADAIWVGARQHGRNLTVPEALGLAHLILTEPMRTQKVREELTSKVKQRAKGMTLRPSKSKAPLGREGEKPKTPAELERRTEARLAKLRGRM